MSQPIPFPTAERGNQSEDTTALDLLRVINRRRWIAFIVFVLVCGAGAVMLIRAPRIFRTTAKIVIEQKTPLVLGRQTQEIFNQDNIGMGARQTFYETQFELIRSRPVAQIVIDELNLDPKWLLEQVAHVRAPERKPTRGDGPGAHLGLPSDLLAKVILLGLEGAPNRAALIDSLEKVDAPSLVQGIITVKPVNKTGLVRISGSGTNPERTAILVNAVAKAFTDHNLRQKIDRTASAVDWLITQVGDLKSKVENSEQAIHDFKVSHNVVSVSLEDRRSITSRTLEHLSEQLVTMRVELLRLEITNQQLKRLQASDDADAVLVFGEVATNGSIQSMRAELGSLRRERLALLQQYREAHPKVVRLSARISTLNEMFAAEVNRAIQVFEQTFEATSLTVQRLSREVDTLKSQALEINARELEFRRLDREAKNNVNLYNMVLKRQKETQLAQMLNVNNVRFLQPAKTPRTPVSPRIPVGIAMTVLLGAALAVAAVFGAEVIDNTVKSQRQVEERLGLPFLGILPKIDLENGAKSADPGTRDLFIIDNPRSSVAECSRSIRTNLLFMSPENTAKKLIVTSSRPKEGKSTTAVQLAITMASSGARTLLVDTDMRRPRLHRSFGAANDYGLTNVILGDQALTKAIQHTPLKELDFLPCGPIPPNPSELLHTEAFKRTVEEAAELYDRIIFDTPPVSAVTDSLILGSMMDGVIVVLKAGKTTLPAAKDTVKRLRDIGANIMGALLNDVDLNNRQAQYYYAQYYHYYRSGYYYDEEEAKRTKGKSGDSSDSGTEDESRRSA